MPAGRRDSLPHPPPFQDATIRACVQRMGMRWRLIAPHLPGRSDDSVRNRWKRLREEDEEAEAAAAERPRVERPPPPR